MAKVKPNQTCPCSSGEKFKKCCEPYLKGQKVDHPERLLRVRHVATVAGDIDFLWNSFHPMAPRRLHDTRQQFEAETSPLKNLDHKELILIDGEVHDEEARIVQYVKVFDGTQELSYLEESEFKLFETQWTYFDGLRRSSLRLGCDPTTVRVGELDTLFPWTSSLN